MNNTGSGGVKFGLSMMMFLQIFIWGAWFELNFGYLPSLGFNSDWQQPLILGAFNVAALLAMFFGTQFVDRRFSAEKFLAFSHLIGGLAIGGLFFVEKGWTMEVGGNQIDYADESQEVRTRFADALSGHGIASSMQTAYEAELVDLPPKFAAE